MSKRNWVTIAAVGLIAALHSPAFSQSPEQSEESQPQSEGQKHASEQGAAESGFPVRILKVPEEPESARIQQQEAADREIDVLAAQQGMNEGTQRLVQVSIAQTVLAFFGTAALLYSLHLNRRATNAATTAAKAATRQADFTEDSFRRMERPYLFPKILERWQLSNAQGVQPKIEYTLTNYGKTPAIMDSLFIELLPISELQFRDGKPFIPDDAEIEQWYEVVPAGQDLNNRKSVPLAGSQPGDRWDYKRESLALHCDISYSDPSSMVRYSHHFVMLSYNDGPFRLDFNDHAPDGPLMGEIRSADGATATNVPHTARPPTR